MILGWGSFGHDREYPPPVAVRRPEAADSARVNICTIALFPESPIAEKKQQEPRDTLSPLAHMAMWTPHAHASEAAATADQCNIAS
jgi:hypothetical protein